MQLPHPTLKFPNICSLIRTTFLYPEIHTTMNLSEKLIHDQHLNMYPHIPCAGNQIAIKRERPH